jgi:hypothetical protein
MDRNSMDTQTPAEDPAGIANQRARIALRAALAMLVPLARWLVRNGVLYASFAPALKSVFVEAARRELQDAGAKITDSSLSVLSGVHRRDIRESRDAARSVDHAQAPKSPSAASMAFTRWLTDPDYRDAANRPAELPKSGFGRSFDSLARLVSSDVHPRTLLAEMQRLGLVELRGDAVALCSEAFVPQQGFAEDAGVFSAQVADHIAAAAHNLSVPADAPRFLEQSMYGSGLSPRSVGALGDRARALWAEAFEQIVREATQHYENDRSEPDARMRVRFGVYYYAEPQEASAAQARQEENQAGAR